jgi:hypothetical protein
MVRKSVKPAPISANVQPSPLINLLVAIARPDAMKLRCTQVRFCILLNPPSLDFSAEALTTLFNTS